MPFTAIPRGLLVATVGVVAAAPGVTHAATLSVIELTAAQGGGGGYPWQNQPPGVRSRRDAIARGTSNGAPV